MNENKMIKLLNSERLSLDDLIAIAKEDYSDFSDETVDLMYKALNDILYEYGTEYSEYDEQYHDNTYMSGYELDGVIFKTCYSGIAGHYWGDTIAESIIDRRNRD